MPVNVTQGRNGQLANINLLGRGDDALDFMKRAIKASVDILGDWRREAATNLRWISGLQWMDWSKNSGAIEKDPRFDEMDDDRSIPIWTNFMRRAIISRITKINRSRITWGARPASNDSADIQSANVLRKLLPHWWRSLAVDNPDNLWEAWWHFFATGIVYANPIWDIDDQSTEEISASVVRKMVREFVSELPDDERAQIVSGGDMEVERQFFIQKVGVSPESVRRTEDGGMIIDKGGPELRFITGFDVIEDFSARRWQDKRWAMIRYRLPVEVIREKYGAKAAHVTGKVRDDSTPDDEQLRPNTIDMNSGMGVFNQADVWVLWHRQSKKYPRGLFVEMVEDRIVRKGENPYDHQDIPLIPATENPDPWPLRPSPTMSDLFILQRAYNRLDVQIAYHINQTIDPDWQAEKGAIDDDYLDGDRSIRLHNPGRPEPHPAPVEQLAPHVLNFKVMLENQIKEVGGLSDPNVGIPDDRARSGRAITALQDREDELLTIAVESFRRMLQRVGEKIVELHGQFAQDDRTVQIVGEDDRREVLTFSGKNFVSRSQNDGRPGTSRFDIIVDIEQPPSRDSLISEIDFLIERGLLNPAIHREQIFAAIRDGNSDALDTSKADRVDVADENARFKIWNELLTDGTLDQETVVGLFEASVRVGPGDDPNLHLARHDEWLVKNKDTVHPVIEQLVIRHNSQHTAVIQANQQQQQGVANQAGGGTQGGGVPPGVGASPTIPQQGGVPAGG